MDLKTFVADSLAQIAEAIEEARGTCAERGMHIAPRARNFNHCKIEAENDNPSYAFLQEIHFDIAVTVSEKGNESGGITVVGSLFGVTVDVSKDKLKQETANSTVSRISFDVPVAFPGK